jgi:crotonobetainyl-CoA:carnitine CoA-transferase CaiB-like acyl-CoA transferase
VVRTSLLAAVVGVHAFQGTRWTVAGEVPAGTGNHHAAIAPYGLLRAADGALQVAVGSETQWRSFAGTVGLAADDPRFATNAARVQHRDELIAEIERVFATAPTDHWLELLADAGIASGQVRTIDQVYEWEQAQSQGLLIDVEHFMLGRFKLPGPPLRFDGLPARRHAAPPLLGEHDESVRAWLDKLDATSEP